MGVALLCHQQVPQPHAHFRAHAHGGGEGSHGVPSAGRPSAWPLDVRTVRAEREGGGGVSEGSLSSSPEKEQVTHRVSCNLRERARRWARPDLPGWMTEEQAPRTGPRSPAKQPPGLPAVRKPTGSKVSRWLSPRRRVAGCVAGRVAVDRGPPPPACGVHVPESSSLSLTQGIDDDFHPQGGSGHLLVTRGCKASSRSMTTRRKLLTGPKPHDGLTSTVHTAAVGLGSGACDGPATGCAVSSSLPFRCYVTVALGSCCHCSLPLGARAAGPCSGRSGLWRRLLLASRCKTGQ